MFTRSEKTERLLAIFRGCNDTLSYERLEQEMGENIEELRPTITNVRRYLERDEGIVFSCVQKVGYRRLTDAEKLESASGFTRKIRRTAGNGVQRLNAISDPGSLSNEDQLSSTLKRTVFEAVQREAAE